MTFKKFQNLQFSKKQIMFPDFTGWNNWQSRVRQHGRSDLRRISGLIS
jgi:hypothetical protein